VLEADAAGGVGRRAAAAKLGEGGDDDLAPNRRRDAGFTKSDYKVLEQDLGPAGAMATYWWLCRGLYMTRVSDGFQLPLERDNVFADFFGKDSARKDAAPGYSK
jgi:hypothetical protein